MHIVTVATKSEGYFNYLVESCKRNGGKLEVLGWGQEWKGFMMKIYLFKDYLNNLDDDDIVCFVDGYDVIILQPVDKIETLFRNSGKKILFSQDSNADIIPFIEMFCKYYFGTYKNYRLNAGTFIGYVKYFKKIFNNICNEYNCNDKNLDDQIIFTKICNKYNSNSFFVLLFFIFSNIVLKLSKVIVEKSYTKALYVKTSLGNKLLFITSVIYSK
jgi:hypothetical protein